MKLQSIESSISIFLAWALIINKEPFQEDLNWSPFLIDGSFSLIKSIIYMQRLDIVQ